MKLEFKFSLVNFIGFLILGSLFYWLCPLPANPLWRAIACTAAALILFGMCFVVVSHKGIIKSAAKENLYSKKPKHKK